MAAPVTAHFYGPINIVCGGRGRGTSVIDFDSGIFKMRQLLCPRLSGVFFLLQQLKTAVNWFHITQTLVGHRKGYLDDVVE